MRSICHYRVVLLGFVLVSSLALWGCAAPAPRRSAAGIVVPSPRPADTRVFAYATRGQSAETQSRDRFECHEWAVAQAGVDPSSPGSSAARSVPTAPAASSAANTAAVVNGAVAGAVVGAVVARPRDTGRGAIIGAVAGGLLGEVNHQARVERQQRMGERIAERHASREEEREAGNYRRALSACLEGRGYSVR